MGSMKPFLWTVAIIATINFMFAICFVQAAAGYRHGRWKEANLHGFIETEEQLALYHHWASVQRAMYTLAKVSTGGQNWGEIADLMFLIGWPSLAVFILYMMLYLFV